MDKEKLQARIEELRKQNDEANQIMVQLDQKRSQVIQEILVRNGRILGLEEALKELN
jgi:uncharacterized coiled-coil DUF342 family protein